jgi:LynF/TruF/PatF family peptide O-prenyltransferase
MSASTQQQGQPASPLLNISGIRDHRCANPLIHVYDFHKKEFGLKENKFLRLFESLLYSPCCSILECSVKISPQGIHAGRLRLGYEKEYIYEGLHAIEGFLHDVSQCKNVNLNHSIFAQIINSDFDFSKVIAIGVGLDSKTDMNASKVKCYFMVSGYPEKVEQVISLHPRINGIREYLLHEEFTFGIDMYFDGRTSVEIYPYLNRQDFNNASLMTKLKLRDATEDLIEQCNLLHFSFDGDGKRILYFFNPQSPAGFVRLLGNRRLSLAYSHVQILNNILSRSYKNVFVLVNLCLMEDEITARDIQNIGLQYALTFRI